MSVFLDANILFSASNPNSSLARFLKWLGEREKLVSSPYALAEARRNIILKRPDWRGSFEKLVTRIDYVAERPLSLDVGLPDKDKPILGAAIAAKCDYLVTGDKRDFGPLYGKTVEGVMIVSTLTLAEIMLEKHGG